MNSSPVSIKKRVIGVDVAKETVVLHDSASERTITVSNEPRDLAAALAGYGSDDLIVCEVTGGYERRILQAALTLGVPAHRADPSRVKSFIRSHGGLAKTDDIDARWLARYGLERGPSLARWQARSVERDTLASFVRHRRDLVTQRVQATNRRGGPAVGDLAPFLDAEIDFLQKQIKALDHAIGDLVKRTEVLADDERKLRAISGIGPIVARALLAFIPELGSLNRRQVASLAGLAPHPHQSGRTVGGVRTRGGRRELRPLLFIAAMSAARSNGDLKAFFLRLTSTGKPKMLALNAVARKIVVLANAVLKPTPTPTQLT